MEVIDTTVETAKAKYIKDHNTYVKENNKLKGSATEKPASLKEEQMDPDYEILSELISSKLDAIGFRIGARISERYSVDIPCFTDDLSVIKCLCKDIWAFLFGKQIDNLKTNHKGVFIIQDYRFRWVTKIKSSKEKASQYLTVVSGIVRGILDNYGIKATVACDVDLPRCTFNITVQSSVFKRNVR
ncbi:hypothetical protein BB561_001871 [Smittium simulii]|uniref:Trafficking protein particle complex subunit n=1 Tax=Smittium simulii TaxID=133385 RepID=A0A2T9YSL8_9FUNG|nr:hypothetical protein BB561_001871 [Smittium simulii]